MSYSDLERNLDTHGDGEDGPEVQAYYKALAGLDSIISDTAWMAEDKLMEIVAYVFEHFDDPREDV